jgi:hypothetical protein
MRTAAAATALGFTLLMTAGLAACVPDDPVGPPSPGPSGTPVFASEEEALAAAEEVYGEYLAASNDLGESGWADSTALAEFTRGDLLADEEGSAQERNEKGWRQIGRSTFDSFTLQQVVDSGPGTVVITAYLCVDVTTVDVVDSSGQSVVSPERPPRQPIEVDLDDQEGDLKVSRSEAWSGQDFC